MSMISRSINRIVAVALLSITVAFAAQATEQSHKRQEARDTRQDTRSEARDTKHDCKQADDKSNHDCRMDKRETKQDGRQEARHIKYY